MDSYCDFDYYYEQEDDGEYFWTEMSYRKFGYTSNWSNENFEPDDVSEIDI